MDPIQEYLADIATRLPRHKRQNVLAELRSNIDDRVEELKNEGRTTEAAVVQAIAELGDPNELAAEYGGGRVIVPATRYHIFKGAALTLMGVHLVATLVATALDLDMAVLFIRVPNLRSLPVQEVLWLLATQVLADIGLVTIAFWFAELTMPRPLPGLSVRVRTAEAKPRWSGLIGPLVLLGVFNVWRNEVFALYTANAEGWHGLPILNEAFVQTYLGPINLILVLALGVHTYKIISGPTAVAAGAELIYRLAAFALTSALLGAAQPFDLPLPEWEAMESVFVGLFRLALLGVLFGNAFAIYRAGARLADRLK